LYLSGEAGEFQMGMCIDQAGGYNGLAKLLRRSVWRPRYYSIRSYLGDPAVIVDQERGVLDRRSLYWNQPSGGQPARPHFSAEC
jgi:hypothetical protein